MCREKGIVHNEICTTSKDYIKEICTTCRDYIKEICTTCRDYIKENKIIKHEY